MYHLTRLTLSFALATFLLAGCGIVPANTASSMGMPGEVDDPAQYASILSQAGSSPALAHFPSSIPANASLVRFHYHPKIFQGGTALQLRLRLPVAELEDASSRFAEVSVSPNGMPMPRFYTGDANEQNGAPFPSSYDILALGATDLGSEGNSWNHGVAYGVAVNHAASEIVYWYEDW